MHSVLQKLSIPTLLQEYHSKGFETFNSETETTKLIKWQRTWDSQSRVTDNSAADWYMLLFSLNAHSLNTTLWTVIVGGRHFNIIVSSIDIKNVFLNFFPIKTHFKTFLFCQRFFYF